MVFGSGFHSTKYLEMKKVIFFNSFFLRLQCSKISQLEFSNFLKFLVFISPQLSLNRTVKSPSNDDSKLLNEMTEVEDHFHSFKDVINSDTSPDGIKLALWFCTINNPLMMLYWND